MEWQAVGGALRTIDKGSPWWIGDWLLYGERKYGRMYEKALEETGYAYGTLANFKSVSALFEFSRRRENVPWSHHALVASLEPAAQDEWLNRAEQSRWSLRELRARVNGHKYSGSERPDPDAGATVPLEKAASQELADLLTKPARAQVARSEAAIKRLTARKTTLGIRKATGRKRRDALIREHRATAHAAKKEERRVRSQVALLGLPDIPQDLGQAKSVLPIFREVRARIVTALDDDPGGPPTPLQDPKLSQQHPALYQYLVGFVCLLDTLFMLNDAPLAEDLQASVAGAPAQSEKSPAATSPSARYLQLEEVRPE